jgi:hypothetical protein
MGDTSPRGAAELDGLLDFGHPIRAGRNRCSNSIVAWMFHLLSRMSLKRLRDRRVTLAERNVPPLFAFRSFT